MAVRIAGGVRDHAAVSRSGIGLVERARGRCAIDPDIGVVDDFRIAGPEFEAAHELPACHRQRHHEDPEDIGAFGLQAVRLGKRDHQVGRAELPAFGPDTRGTGLSAVAFRSALGDPLPDRGDFAGGQRALPDEWTIAGLTAEPLLGVDERMALL